MCALKRVWKLRKCCLCTEGWTVYCHYQLISLIRTLFEAHIVSINIEIEKIYVLTDHVPVVGDGVPRYRKPQG